MILHPSRDFRRACGLKDPLELGLEPPGASRVDWQRFEQPFVVVGRDAEADLTLGHPKVSGRHAYFQIISGRLFCVDLYSRTGTFWDGRRDTWGWADREPGVSLGPFRIRTRRLESRRELSRRVVDDVLPTSRSFDQQSTVDAVLDFVDSAGDEPANWRVSRSLVLIGSSMACKIYLTKPGIARIHASLVRTQDALWLVDLLGNGDVGVNGRPLRFAQLEHGDEIAIGAQKIRVRLDRSVDKTSASTTLPAKRQSRRSVPELDPRPVQDRLAVTASHGGSASLLSGGDVDLNLTLPGDLKESLMKMVLGEVSQMQLQMAEQFQQSLMLMFRSFVDMHQEQTALIREELARIGELTEEQQRLQAELARRSSASAAPPVLRLVGGGAQGESFERPARNPVPLSLTSSSGEPPKPSKPPKPPTTRADRDTTTTGPPDPDAIESNKCSEPANDERDFHLQLVERLASIRQERESRWRKLMDAVLGRKR
jgi:pSer/pThr/pTyr-binding forkhead associated (FHA) protein